MLELVGRDEDDVTLVRGVVDVEQVPHTSLLVKGIHLEKGGDTLRVCLANKHHRILPDESPRNECLGWHRQTTRLEACLLPLDPLEGFDRVRMLGGISGELARLVQLVVAGHHIAGVWFDVTNIQNQIL